MVANQGVRLRDLTAGELVALAYHLIIESIREAEDYADRRAELDRGLAPIRRRPTPGSDAPPRTPAVPLPERLQQIQPPAWWNDDD